jgi:hypothetical protein
MDSVEGIVEWWIPRHHIRTSVDRVARALAALESQGLIERTGDSERPLFRLRAQTETPAAGTPAGSTGRTYDLDPEGDACQEP